MVLLFNLFYFNTIKGTPTDVARLITGYVTLRTKDNLLSFSGITSYSIFLSVCGRKVFAMK